MAYSKPAFNLPFGVYVAKEEHTDVRYGPYTSVDSPSTAGDVFHIDSPIYWSGSGPSPRVKGLTVGVIQSGSDVKEYWFKDGVTDVSLVEKTTPASGGVTSIDSQTGDVTLTDLSLENVDNTSDINKPVSTLQQQAINDALASVMVLQGDWNANTNTPDITGTTITGHSWRVTTAGTTDLDGITSWDVGDWAVKSETGWIKIGASDVVLQWGSITGTLANQTDLQNALDTKENSLGNPTTDNDILSSTIAGVRTWISNPGAGGGIYVPAVNPAMTTPEDIGGIPKGTTASSLTNETISAMLDKILFGTVLAYIHSYQTSNLQLQDISGGSETHFEVGTLVTVTLEMLFYAGLITNGDSTTGPALVGTASNYELLLNSTQIDTGALSEFIDTDRQIILGDLIYSGIITYGTGIGDYFDNTNSGIPSTNLDVDRIGNTQDTNPANNITMTGGYYLFTDTGMDTNVIPLTSEDVRAMDHSKLLTANNAGVYYMTIPQGTKYHVIAIPATASLYIATMNNEQVDLIPSFENNESNFNVDDAAGNSVAYRIMYIQTSGYAETLDYHLEIR